MSLFEFIENLQTPQKHALYQDKPVCICIFRVAFTPVEQQILMRLAFMSSGRN
jgi:hypothetical protein